MNQDPETDFDVIVLGAGMAGLGLARQLILQRPGTRILVLDKRDHPAPLGAYKVGESTVEIGAWYLDHVLQLGDHLREQQLPKYGLRFFFNQPGHQRLDEGLEVGLTRRFPHSSYQLDRGKLENFMVEDMARLGVTVTSAAKVDAIELGEDQAPHWVNYLQNNTHQRVSSRWVVDASGRAGILKRQLGLGEKISHRINSAWFRINARLRIDDWCPWREMGPPECANHSRWLSTIHLMGEGYWVWLIPLSCGATSVGIVADPRHHPLSEFNSFERALAWLGCHQPLCAAAVAEQRDKFMDFLALKHFSYACKQVFSAERWALVGEAGYFPDPFYSPGSDFIALGNTFTLALIQRDLAKKPFAGMAQAFDETYKTLFHNTMRIYKDQYPMFGNPGVMTFKIVWDYTTYWAFIALSAIQGRFTDTASYAAIGDSAARIGTLNARMQAFFRQWHQRWQPTVRERFLDQTTLPLMYKFNAELKDDLDSAGFVARIGANLDILEQLSLEIISRAAADNPELNEFKLEDRPVATDFMAPVWQALSLHPIE